jgi:hypothetical protein
MAEAPLEIKVTVDVADLPIVRELIEKAYNAGKADGRRDALEEGFAAALKLTQQRKLP